MGGSKAQRKRRLRRVLELATAGMTIPEISVKMKGEGFAASERTVWSALHSIEAKDYQEEILRKQLTDITIADIDLRLKYRDKLLDKIMPQKIETKAEVTVDKKEYTIVLSDVGAKTWEKVKEETKDEPEDSESTPE